MAESENFEAFDGENIFEPLLAYKNVYKETFNRNATECLDNLVQQSQVNIEANHATTQKIRKLEGECSETVKKIKKRTRLKGFLIFLIVVGFIAAIAGIIFIVDKTIVALPPYAPILMIVIGLVISVLLIILIAVTITPKLKELRNAKAVLDKKIAEQQKEAWAQMAPLNALFRRGMSIDLFRKTIPIINLDKMFDRKRLDYLVNKFGLHEAHDVNRSSLYVQSGDIVGNPFFIANDLVHRLGTKTYTGELVISWTTTSYINGRYVTVNHTETLRASLDKPCPYYHEEPYLVYGNEAAPDLIFSRQDSDAEKMSEKQIDKMVDRETKKLNKAMEKSVKQGGSYTVMGNSEFEVLFGASNRNNEVQFRLLFTPLAQKQLLQIMKDKEVAYGDNFDFVKHKMINILYPEHLRNFPLDVGPSYYSDYDYDMIRKKFLYYNNTYFKAMFFTFAPVLAIPLYQQQKPHEYVYKDLYDSYISFYEHEHIVNEMNATQFIHPLSRTPNILKTSVVKSGDFMDTIQVTAYGYQTINRTDYVAVMGGDGHVHNVPVNWVEYIPVAQQSDIGIKLVEEEKAETYADKFRKAFESVRDGKLADEKDIFRVGLFLAYFIGNKKSS
ncbi:MAG TPA: hypothetical protein PKO28_04930 [Bacilli bacterium]|nr:hypothetical protein [Bacilli bacterium]